VLGLMISEGPQDGGVDGGVAGDTGVGWGGWGAGPPQKQLNF
jgi:hypothetical protein